MLAQPLLAGDRAALLGRDQLLAQGVGLVGHRLGLVARGLRRVGLGGERLGLALHAH